MASVETTRPVGEIDGAGDDHHDVDRIDPDRRNMACAPSSPAVLAPAIHEFCELAADPEQPDRRQQNVPNIGSTTIKMDEICGNSDSIVDAGRLPTFDCFDQNP